MPTAVELGVADVEWVVTDLFGIEGRKRGDEMDIWCPFGHERRLGSCSINLETGNWKCLACGKAGDLIILGMYKLDLPYDDAKRLLEPSTPEALIATVQRKLAAAIAPRKRSRQVELPGPYEDGPLDELRERYFTDDTLQRWGVRYAREQEFEGKNGVYTIRNSIAIPIRDERRALLSWCYRKTNDSPSWQPRYLYTPDVPLSEIWFGLEHHARVRDIVVTEGALDAMWFDQAGIPALALLGSEMGERKIKMLAQYRTVTIMGDLDVAGELVARRIGGMIGDRSRLRIARYPRWCREHIMEELRNGNKVKVDPCNLPAVDLELAVATALPWTTWLARSRSAD
jgi:DNA primase